MRLVTMGVIYPAFDKSPSNSLVSNPIHTLTLGKINPENHYTVSLYSGNPHPPKINHHVICNVGAVHPQK